MDGVSLRVLTKRRRRFTDERVSEPYAYKLGLKNTTRYSSQRNGRKEYSVYCARILARYTERWRSTRRFVVEGHLMSDHEHICLSKPPKYAVSNEVGYIEGKRAITMARK